MEKEAQSQEPQAGFLARAINAYLASYRGLTRLTWLLTLGCFIQRAGTMVLPFLTVYLANEAGLSAPRVASVVLFHGVGAIVGSLLATQTTQRFSARTNMLGSLVATAVAIVGLYFAQGYWMLCVCAAAMMLFEAPFRPAIMAEISGNEPEERQAQAFALLRAGVNAGMMLGPAVGGMLAMLDYGYLFFIDAATCIAAAFWIASLKLSSHAPHQAKPKQKRLQSAGVVLSDPVFVLLWLGQLLQFLVVFQLISALPLFLNQARGFNEAQIGRYFLINGALILGVEMWLVQRVRRFPPALVFGLGACVMALGIAAVEVLHAPWMLYVSVIVWTLGEMVSMPLITSIVATRSSEHAAAYLSWFSTATNVALVIGAPAGLWMADHYGFRALWLCVAALGILSLGLGLLIHRGLKKSPP